MKKFVSLVAFMVIALFSLNSLAWDPPPSPAPVSWISDTSNVLSPAAHARLDAKLKVINQSSANEIAALILPTLDGEDIANVGDLTAKSWGVGKKDLDNGVLVVLAMKEHKSRISTGKGVEGDLPDLKANDILAKVLRPHMRANDVEGGLSATFEAVSSSIANHRAEVASGKQQRPSCQVSNPGATDGGTGIWLVLASIAGVALFTVWYSARSARRRKESELAASRERMRIRAQMALERQNADREARRKAEEVRKSTLNIATPVVNVPHISTPPSSGNSVRPTRPAVPRPNVPSKTAAVAAAASAATESARLAQEEAQRHARIRREEEDRRKRREREEEDERRKRSSESSSSSSYSSSSDYSSGGSSGGFGGGDSGGGGSSSDW